MRPPRPARARQTRGYPGRVNAATLGGRRIRRLRGLSCAQVTLLVGVLYVAWTAAYLATPGHDVRDFIHIGTSFIEQGGHRSRAIHLDLGYHPPTNQNPAARGTGYDGQFYYYIALDPANARFYVDIPGYRYSRILYPMVARALALGHREAIPWTLLLVNLLAVLGGTWGLATWLRRRGVSPLWAMLYGLWPGMVVAVQRDLAEPLAYGLVVAGLLVWDVRRGWRLPAAGVVFGLAGLARQTTLVFPIVYGVWLALGRDPDETSPTIGSRRWRDVLAFLALSLGPIVAYSIFLYAWLGSLSNGGDLTPVPFGGIFHEPYLFTRQGIDVGLVVLPALVALVVLAPRRGRRMGQLWLPWSLMIANVLVNIVFFADFYLATYTAVSRQAIGIVLSGLMCLPYAGELTVGRRRWLAGMAALGMILLPVVAVYGFTNLSA